MMQRVKKYYGKCHEKDFENDDDHLLQGKV